MKRRNFLTTTLAATALAASAKRLIAKDSPNKGFIVKAGEARMNAHTPFMGVNPNDLKISSKDTNGALSAFEYVGTQKIGPLLHVHMHQDEVFHVIEGNYLFQLDTEKFKLFPGDMIFLPRNVPHTWVQLTDHGKLIYYFQPAGKMEEFFQKMNSLKRPPTDEEVQKIALEHGVKNIGPALSPE